MSIWKDDTDAAWHELSRRTNLFVDRLTGRGDIIVSVTPDLRTHAEKKKASRPAGVFYPTKARLHMDASQTLPVGMDDLSLVDPDSILSQRRFPAYIGIGVHESAHAKHSIAFPRHDNPWVNEWITVLEEPRCENRMLQNFPQYAMYLKAASKHIFSARSFSMDAIEAGHVLKQRYEAARLAILLLARADAGILTRSDTAEIENLCKKILGDNDFSLLRNVWLEVFQLDDDCADEMIALGLRVQEIVDPKNNAKHDDTKPQETPCGSPSDDSDDKTDDDEAQKDDDTEGAEDSDDSDENSDDSENGENSDESDEGEDTGNSGESDETGEEQGENGEGGDPEASDEQGESGESGEGESGESGDNSKGKNSGDSKESVDNSSSDGAGSSPSIPGEDESDEDGSDEDGSGSEDGKNDSDAADAADNTDEKSESDGDTDSESSEQGNSPQGEDAEKDIPLSDLIQKALNVVAEISEHGKLEISEIDDSNPVVVVRNEQKEKMERRKEINEAKGTVKVASGKSSGRFSSIPRVSVQDPSARDISRTRALGVALEKAQYRAVHKTQMDSLIPPGRFTVRQAMNRSAQVAMKQEITATPWKQTRRREMDNPPITLAVASDVSGSMDVWQREISSFTWAFAQAVSKLQGKAGAVVWNSETFGLIEPGKVTKQIPVSNAAGGSTGLPNAIKALDGMMELSFGEGVRMLAVITDGHLGTFGNQQAHYAKIQEELNALVKYGVKILWILTDKSGWSPENAVIAVLDSPDDFGRIVGAKAIEALARA